MGNEQDLKAAKSTVTDLDINALGPLTELGPYGEFTPFDDIQVGVESEAIEWTITEDSIDAVCAMQDEYHEWYSIASPFGGRVAPLMASSQILSSTLSSPGRRTLRGLGSPNARRPSSERTLRMADTCRRQVDTQRPRVGGARRYVPQSRRQTHALDKESACAGLSADRRARNQRDCGVGS